MNFQDWSATAESLQTIQASRDIVHDVYRTPNKIEITHRVCMPSNPFAKPWEQAIVGYTMLVTNAQRVKDAGGELNCEDFYTEDGYGVATFSGEDALEKAYNFSQTLK